MEKISNVQLREFKSRGQLLEPSLKIGKEGLTPAFYAALVFLTLMGMANARSAFIYFQF